MNEAHEKLRELLVAIRSVLTKYKECDFEWDRVFSRVLCSRRAGPLPLIIKA